MVTNSSFLEVVAKEKKRLLFLPVCRAKDITKAVNIFKKYKQPFVIMHCVSTYPCPEDTLNLNLIRTYKNKYKCDVGYSGHESTVSPSIAAWFLGAKVIERHITLDRASGNRSISFTF